MWSVLVKLNLKISLATNMLKIGPLCIFLPKLSEYRRESDETFLIKDDELLEEYNEIWENVKNSIKKEFDSELVHNEKYLKAKIKSYNGKSSANYTIMKQYEGSRFHCLSVILVDSVFKTGKNYYPQVFLEKN